jgi:hypothetical protein
LDLQWYHEVVVVLAAARIKAMPLYPLPELHRMFQPNVIPAAPLAVKTSLK